MEVSLQPWRAFRPDGVILFSDILTPLTGMNIPFDITAGKGPIIADPIRTMQVRRRRGARRMAGVHCSAAPAHRRVYAGGVPRHVCALSLFKE